VPSARHTKLQVTSRTHQKQGQGAPPHAQENAQTRDVRMAAIPCFLLLQQCCMHLISATAHLPSLPQLMSKLNSCRNAKSFKHVTQTKPQSMRVACANGPSETPPMQTTGSNALRLLHQNSGTPRSPARLTQQQGSKVIHLFQCCSNIHTRCSASRQGPSLHACEP
jgi:hypothetical protein